MRLVRGFSAALAAMGPQVVAMGNFDGVHEGHRRVISRIVESARHRGIQSCILTFFPHPLQVLAPERAPRMIQSLEDRLETLARSGVDLVVVVPFTMELARVEADDFIRDYLVGRLGCVELHVGADARFGRGRKGDVELLRAHAAGGLFHVEVAGEVLVEGQRVSSSGIRRFIEAGNVETAAGWLGRPFSLTGEIVPGARRGTGMGFPTANVAPDGVLRPGNGIYAGIGQLGDLRKPAAIHIGPIPTFGAVRPVVEAHLVGFEGDIRGERLSLHFIERLRDVVRFPDVESLRSKIADDVDRTVATLASRGLLDD
jgi:riboflavin kinase/FMN adenylyltransferase